VSVKLMLSLCPTAATLVPFQGMAMISNPRKHARRLNFKKWSPSVALRPAPVTPVFASIDD